MSSGGPPELNLPTYPFVMFGIPVLVGVVVHFIWDTSLFPAAVALGAGVPVFVAGVALGLWSVQTMFSQGEHPEPGHGTNRTITSGPFAFSRNPSYLGLVLTAVGFGLILDSIPVLASIPFGSAVLALWVVPAEERYLAAVLQDDYAAYRARVRRWL